MVRPSTLPAFRAWMPLGPVSWLPTMGNWARAECTTAFSVPGVTTSPKMVISTRSSGNSDTKP